MLLILYFYKLEHTWLKTTINSVNICLSIISQDFNSNNKSMTLTKSFPFYTVIGFKSLKIYPWTKGLSIGMILSVVCNRFSCY